MTLDEYAAAFNKAETEIVRLSGKSHALKGALAQSDAYVERLKVRNAALEASRADLLDWAQHWAKYKVPGESPQDQGWRFAAQEVLQKLSASQAETPAEPEKCPHGILWRGPVCMDCVNEAFGHQSKTRTEQSNGL